MLLDLIILGAIAGGGYYAYTKGYLDSTIAQVKALIGK